MPGVPVHLLLVGGSLAGGVVSLALTAVAWRRDGDAARAFGTLMAVASLWSVAYAGALLVDDPGSTTGLLATATIAAAHVPPLWVVFTLAYTGLDRYRRPVVYALLWAVPVTFTALVVTAPLHGLVTLEVTDERVVGVTVPALAHGWPYWTSVATAYVLVVVGYAVLGWAFYTRVAADQRETVTIVAASLVPVVTNAVFVAGVGVRSGLDPTPLAFALGGAVGAWALFEYDFLSVVPLAGDLLIDELPDPVVVLDDNDRIVEHNDAAASTFGTDELIGTPIESVAPALEATSTTDNLIRVSNGNGERTPALLSPRTTNITDQHGERRGRLIVFQDVTVRQRRMDRIEALQATTERLIEARIDDEVAEIAVSFIERVMGQEIAVVFLAEDDRLRPAAVSAAVGDAIDGRPPDVTADESPLFAQYDQEATGVLSERDWGFEPFDATLDAATVLALSLGDHGLLCLASGDGSEYTDEDRQFATILAGATETALDRVAREQQLRESRRVVRHRTEQLEFLNGVLRHNVRNAIQVIDSNAQLLLRDDAAGKRFERLERIRARSRELSTFTEKIRSITDTLTADGERVWPVDLDQALSTAVERVNEREDVTVTQVGSDYTVLANGLLVDVFEGVLEHAAEHGGQDVVSVEIDVEPLGEWIQVRIADDGPGVSDHLKESLFERDVSVSETAHGFGLYFVAMMMDLYGGDVWFEDNDPTGAIAVLEFQRPTAADAGDEQ
ncbi:MAG: histidine kinase N-terminal 7TM domain-containing protein [Halorhabdus sp.]